MLKFISTAWNRIKAQTPMFFKRLRIAGHTLSATGLTCVSTKMLAPGVGVPATIYIIGTHILVAGFVLSLVSSLAVVDPNDINNNTPKT